MGKKSRVNSYKMDKISTKMARKFGKIKKGNEDAYSFILFSLEGNMLKLHRDNNSRNSRRALEAVKLCLLLIDSYLSDIEYDFTSVINDENKALRDGLRMGFDPFYNEEIKNLVSSMYNLDSAKDMEEYFKTPATCLIRIEQSIELWIDNLGINGYFKFIEQQLGEQVPQDLKMNYTIMGEEKEMVRVIKQDQDE